MPHFPKTHASVRAPRTSFSKPEPAGFRVADQTLPGSLRLLSTTGGCAVLSKKVQGGTFAEIEIPTPLGKVSGLIEFLDKQGGGMQTELAFRFIGLDDTDYQRLTEALKQFG